MRLLIDNGDGVGAVEYSGTVMAEGRIKVMRALGAQTTCSFELLLGAMGLAVPVRKARVVVQRADGSELFAGSLATKPLREYVGESSTGAVYRARLTAVSDAAAQRTGVTHTVADGEGEWSAARLEVAEASALRNDVTVSGAVEPTAFVTEEWIGDGTTSKFVLSGAAFREHAGALAADNFDGAEVDARVWRVNDPGAHVAIGSGGLMLNGGNGQDGQTTLTALNAVEMGGVLVAELRGVSFGAASDGMLSGFYDGSPVLANCFAGWRVRQSASTGGGETVLVPAMQGAEVGSSFTPVAGHLYTLRLRLRCAESYRVGQVYQAMVDGAVQSFGSGAATDAAMDVVFEVVDQGNVSNTPATVLFDSSATGGPVTGVAAMCSFVAVNAAQMFGSVAGVQLRREGTVWVTSVPPSGVEGVRLIGVAGEGVDCVVQSGIGVTPGSVVFLDGRVPVAGERVCVMYRKAARSVARLADAASIANEAKLGGDGVSRWTGKVLQPVTRTSADCESAAAAVLAVATSRSESLRGSYAVVNPAEELWPGDVLQVTSAGETTALLLRSVSIADEGTEPEALRYEAAFGNDWATQLADGLGLRLGDEMAADAASPAVAETGVPVRPASLNALTVTGVTASVLTLDAGCAAVTGGGFEVRRRDGGWGQTGIADFVMRSPVRAFSLPRAAVAERFYVRAFDAAGVYSRVSAVVVANSPMV